jgi:membrane-bound lytic murein transglycosylase D
MTQRISASTTALAWLTTIVCLLLAGCATVPPDGGTADGNPQNPLVLKTATQLGQARAPTGSLPVVEIAAPPQLPQAIDLTSETDDLLQRMRNGFAMPDINNDLVLYHQQWYLNRPDYLRRVAERSSRYLHHIVEELEKRGMPMELALLPMVESAYNPMAYSPAKASGLWQFIPATGKRYNLDQNWWKDERRDILASTAAALDYLQSIYDMHGDWHLALASYNWGEGAVGRAIAKNQAQGLPTDYLSLTMPNETRNYVPKLQALKNIFSNPKLLAELNLQSIPNRAYFATVTPATNIDVKVAAKLAEMPVQEFVALNPSHNRPVIKSDTPVVIPADKIDTFMDNLEAHEGSNKPLSSWQPYTVRPGDKLEKIAPRFGMTVANLKEANGIKGRIKVAPGVTLLVAGSGQPGGEPASVEPPEPPLRAEQPRLPAADPERSHTVRKGETLPQIAKRYGTSVAEIKRINHLRNDKLTVGSHLTLAEAGKAARNKTEKETAKAEKTAKVEKTAKPEKTAKAEKTAGAKNEKSAKAEKPAGKSAPKIARYVIRNGDTLASIAKHFNVSKDDLLRWNRLSPNALTPGKTLTIQLAQNS